MRSMRPCHVRPVPYAPRARRPVSYAPCNPCAHVRPRAPTWRTLQILPTFCEKTNEPSTGLNSM
eukprot:2202939-Prymnesium_polylepis.1